MASVDLLRVAVEDQVVVAKTIWNQFDVLLADLDGVIYEGTKAINGAVSSINDLQSQGIRVGYVTNNSSRKPETITEQLQGFGISSKPEDIISSGQTAVELLATNQDLLNYMHDKMFKNMYEPKEKE